MKTMLLCGFPFIALTAVTAPAAAQGADDVSVARVARVTVVAQTGAPTTCALIVSCDARQPHVIFVQGAGDCADVAVAGLSAAYGERLAGRVARFYVFQGADVVARGACDLAPEGNAP